MASNATFAEIAALAGDPGRAAMLHVLMDGRALTASELAYHAGVSPQTTSSHLAKLADAKLVVVEKQGRHRYYRLAGAAVAEALELLALIVPQRPLPPRRRKGRGGDGDIPDLLVPDLVRKRQPLGKHVLARDQLRRDWREEVQQVERHLVGIDLVAG